MQLDSHRRQLSITMPCPWSRPCNAASNNNITLPNDALPSPTSAPDVEDWKTVRRYHLRLMRKQVRSVVMFMALMEALRVGPVELVYAGKRGYPEAGPEDFGVCCSMPGFIRLQKARS